MMTSPKNRIHSSVCSIDHRKSQDIRETLHTSIKVRVSLMFLQHFVVFCDLVLNKTNALQLGI